MAVGDFFSLIVNTSTAFVPVAGDVWMCLSLGSGYAVDVELTNGAGDQVQILAGATILNKVLDVGIVSIVEAAPSSHLNHQSPIESPMLAQVRVGNH